MLVYELLKNTKFKRLALTLLLVIPFEVLSLFSIHLPQFIEIAVFSIIMLIFGKNVIINGLRSLMHLNFSNINLLMTIAVFGALYLGELEEAVIIIVLFAISETLEEFGIRKSQNSLEELVKKTPKTALIKGHDDKTPIENISVGEILVVKPGDYIPLDCVVVEGNSLVDESTITGEPLPKSKFPGELVYAGTLNTQGYLEIRVIKVSKDTTLAKIVELTFQSIEKKSRATKFIENFALYYTPTIIVIATLLTIVPFFVFGQPFTVWFTQSLTVLLIACPCALVISTPITIFSAIGNATKRGALVKGGQFLEEMGKIRAIAFDKTRTLTKGEPLVSDIVTFDGVSKEELLNCVAGAESLSEHPIAKSIVERANTVDGENHSYSNFKSVMGKGISGECLVCVDKHHCIGTLEYIMEEHKVDTKVIEIVEKFEKEGKTAIVISSNKHIEGVIGVTDTIRSESKQIVMDLNKLGVTSIMLTGDNASAAAYVSKEVGISEFYAKLLPDEKVSNLLELVRKYKNVAMVGDGVNDAPALATASVGIAMGAVGSDVAIENADIALMNNNLSLLPFLISLGRKAIRTIKLNTTLAIGVKLFFLFFALIGKGNLALAIFADVGVTLLVVANSLKLFNYDMETK